MAASKIRQRSCATRAANDLESVEIHVGLAVELDEPPTCSEPNSTDIKRSSDLPGEVRPKTFVSKCEQQSVHNWICAVIQVIAVSVIVSLLAFYQPPPTSSLQKPVTTHAVIASIPSLALVHR